VFLKASACIFSLKTDSKSGPNSLSTSVRNSGSGNPEILLSDERKKQKQTTATGDEANRGNRVGELRVHLSC
jgi:hypothetical protein